MALGISINVDDTIDKAKKIADLANEINGSRKSIDNEIADSQNFWIGSSGDKYRLKLDKISACIEQRADNISKLAEALESSAKRYKSVEEYAKSIFGR